MDPRRIVPLRIVHRQVALPTRGAALRCKAEPATYKHGMNQRFTIRCARYSCGLALALTAALLAGCPPPLSGGRGFPPPKRSFRLPKRRRPPPTSPPSRRSTWIQSFGRRGCVLFVNVGKRTRRSSDSAFGGAHRHRFRLVRPASTTRGSTRWASRDRAVFHAQPQRPRRRAEALAANYTVPIVYSPFFRNGQKRREKIGSASNSACRMPSSAREIRCRWPRRFLSVHGPLERKEEDDNDNTLVLASPRTAGRFSLSGYASLRGAER
jgi:hypothetical protein